MYVCRNKPVNKTRELRENVGERVRLIRRAYLPLQCVREAVRRVAVDFFGLPSGGAECRDVRVAQVKHKMYRSLGDLEILDTRELETRAVCRLPCNHNVF